MSACLCGMARPCAHESEQDWTAVAFSFRVHRTNRLMKAIEMAERHLDALPDESQDIPEALERLNNLCRALVNHRRLNLKGR